MRFSVLGSGSGGNSVYIESGSTSILIDAGFSGKEIEKRLNSVGKSSEQLRAICLTHEHRDHVSGVGVLARRHKLSVWGNEGTIQGSERITKKIPDVREFQTSDIVQLGDLEVRSFPIMHDTSDPVGFIVSDGHYSLGICTDTGHVSHLITKRLAGCDGVILEFNHDPDLLRLGPYPLRLQQRVRSRHGHLANEESAKFLNQICHPELKHVILAHLSETNNTPEHAMKSIESLQAKNPQLEVNVAAQERALPLLNFSKT